MTVRVHANFGDDRHGVWRGVEFGFPIDLRRCITMKAQFWKASGNAVRYT